MGSARPRALGLREGKHPAASRWALRGAHHPSGFARQPSSLRSYVRTCSGQKADKYVSILAEWSPQQPVSARNSPCLITGMSNLLMENLQWGQDWRTWLVRAAEGRIHRRVSGEMCSASAWPGDLNRRDFRELIASWEALNTSQDQACALGAESPTKPRTPGCWNTTCVFKILREREIIDLVREPRTAWRKEIDNFYV